MKPTKIWRTWTETEINRLRDMFQAEASDYAIGEALNRSVSSIAYKRNELHLIHANNKKKRPVPDNFASVAYEPDKILGRHYGVSSFTIGRWRKELGIKAPKGKGRAVPRPDDFAETYQTMSMIALANHYHVAKETVRKWRDECGLKPKEGPVELPMPEGFAEVAPTMCKLELLDHYKVYPSTLNRWLFRAGVKPGMHVRVRTPVPDDFERFARRLGNERLQSHYGVSRTTITRWRQESGIMAPGHVAPTAGQTRVPKLIRDVFVDGSLAARAAHHLRRFYPMVVRVEYTDHVRTHPKGYYVVGNRGVMSPTELIDLAKSKDFDPGAWERVAA